MPPALCSALAAMPAVVESTASAGATATATLLVPLGPSPFHRLLLHALCQYQRLRSKSEHDTFGSRPLLQLVVLHFCTYRLIELLADKSCRNQEHTGRGISRGIGCGIGCGIVSSPHPSICSLLVVVCTVVGVPRHCSSTPKSSRVGRKPPYLAFK